MFGPQESRGYAATLEVLSSRLAEEPRQAGPHLVQLLTGPRQVGKTTLLLALANVHPGSSIYVAGDAPESALGGFWEQLWARAEDLAARRGRALVLIDEAHVLHDWAARIKSAWDRFRRKRVAVHIVASGSSALRLSSGSRESLAGRFERLTLSHWNAASLVSAFGFTEAEAADEIVTRGAYPGAVAFRGDAARWSSYVRDSILEPAIGRDILARAPIRRPALLRQVFAVAAGSPAQIVSLQKLQGQLQDSGALETLAHYLSLLEEAYLIAALPKHSDRTARRRSAPPKLITLSNAILAATASGGSPTLESDPARFGVWVENACLAHAWNAGQQVRYWREEPLEVDAVLEGSWGNWAVEVKVGSVHLADLRALLEFHRRFPRIRPILISTEEGRGPAERAGVQWIDWREYLLRGFESLPR